MIIEMGAQVGGKWILKKGTNEKENSLFPFLFPQGNLLVILEMFEHHHAMIKRKDLHFTLYYRWGSNQTC